MLEHRLHAVCPLGVLAEAGLALDGHPCILGYLAQLVSETPSNTQHTKKRIYLTMHFRKCLKKLSELNPCQNFVKL